ncbi:MAG: zinc ribbon domain-containing protein [Deltaproteobacteria bacterium]|nr:zinc ribbon domain-containing protein [Deltaproteobacteria bacterium]
MPVYEYKCAQCSQTFEISHKISDKPVQKCGRCGGRLERLISQTSFSLKGSGWYKDGYATPVEKKVEKKKEPEKTEVKKEAKKG